MTVGKIGNFSSKSTRVEANLVFPSVPGEDAAASLQASFVFKCFFFNDDRKLSGDL